MAENVVSMHGQEVRSDRKAAFLAFLAASYDDYAAAHGEPDALVYSFGGVGQEKSPGWLMQGASQGAAFDVAAGASLAIAHAATADD